MMSAPASKYLAMNLLDQTRLCEIEEIVVAAKIFALPIFETLAAKVCLGKLPLLDHRSHGAIDDRDSLAQEAIQLLSTI